MAPSAPTTILYNHTSPITTYYIHQQNGNVMIPHIATDGTITFFAGGMPYVIAMDHPNFETVRDLLASGSDDEEAAVRLADVTVAVRQATQGRVTISEDGLSLDGEALPACWNRIAIDTPEMTRILVVTVGDMVRVEGDAEAPDGDYEVVDVDNEDTQKRVMVSSEEGFFGFVANTSIKEVRNADDPVQRAA